ncbi:MAG: redoxin domain-containing protein [Alphaproteobacteria bacterium]
MRLIYVIPLIIITILNIIFYYNIKHPKSTKVLPQSSQENQLESFKLPILGESFKKFSTEDLPSDEYILINFFASWCNSCKYEHELLNKIFKEHNIKIYGIMVRDEEERSLKFLNDTSNPYKLVLNDIDSRFSISLGVISLPESLLVKNNIIINKFKGPLTEEIYRQQIKPYL